MKLSSKNKTILVFSDVHQDVYRVKQILKKENHDIAVCLGDWYDSFIYKSEENIINTSQCIMDLIDRDNFYTLFGNHDVHYLFNNKSLACSGYTKEKHAVIQRFFKDKITHVRDKFHWFIWIDDFLCSHAGINKYFFPVNINVTNKDIDKWLTKESKVAREIALYDYNHWFLQAGYARGGELVAGGLIWQDFDIEFIPIDGVKQLVGHTPHNSILPPIQCGLLDYTESDNLDIDCHLNQYLKITDGKLSIHNYLDL